MPAENMFFPVLKEACDMADALIISGTAVVSGAEYVLADYIKRSRHKSRMALAVSSPEKVRKFYSLLGVPVISGACLDQTGAAATGNPLKLAKKAANYAGSFSFLRGAIKKTGASITVGNNTGDVIYSLPSILAGAVHYNFMHDVLKKNSAAAFVLRLFDGYVKHYIAVCGAVRDSIVSAGVSPDKVSVIYNGIERSKNVFAEKKGPALKIGFAGSIEARKNPMEFLDFIAELRLAGVKAAASIAAGNIADAKLMERLKARAKEMREVKILGPLDRKKMRGFYRELDLLVVASSCDALPNVILEAFASAVPVLGRRTGGIPEMITHKKTGLLYESAGDFAGLARGIRDMGRNGLKKLGKKAYDEAAAKFDINLKTEKTDSVLFGAKRGRLNAGGTEK